MLSIYRASLRVRRVLCLQTIDGSKRPLITLAIESSCDDTSVAILEKHAGTDTHTVPSVKLHFHEKITSNNIAHRGVHPIVALESHEENLAQLVNTALLSLPSRKTSGNDARDDARQNQDVDSSLRQKPDFVTVTRGPGMRSNLATGLNMAKGLAVAWQVPLVAVNHMQAHALTPRLVSAMANANDAQPPPAFPFLSLLVSGGHTMLIHSKSLTDHPTLATTADIAIGDAIDKMARLILPPEVLETSQSTMYGPLLERFAFPDTEYGYTAPKTREQELTRKITSWGWSFGPPLAETRSGSKSKALEYSFTGLCSSAKRIVEGAKHPLSEEERRDLAKESMRVAFEHLASRVVLWLNHAKKTNPSMLEDLETLVVSGGVAANKYLRYMYVSRVSNVGEICPNPMLVSVRSLTPAVFQRSSWYSLLYHCAQTMPQ